MSESGEAGELRTILSVLSSFGFGKQSGGFPGPAVAPRSRMCSSHSRDFHKLCRTSSSISSAQLSTSPCFTWQSAKQASRHCPQNFDTFHARPESELPGIRVNKESIFSPEHFIRSPTSSPHTFFCSFIMCSSTHMPNAPKFSALRQRLFSNLSWTHAERHCSDNEDVLIGNCSWGGVEKTTEEMQLLCYWASASI